MKASSIDRIDKIAGERPGLQPRTSSVATDGGEPAQS
jgi:hypothetical protein